MSRVAQRASKLPETAIVCLIMTALAVSTTIIGTILLLLAGEFNVPLENGGIFTVVQNIGCFAGILTSGFLLDRRDTRTVILAALAIFTLSCYAVAHSGALVSYLAILFLMGAAFRFLDASLNVRISEMHDEKKGLYLNLLHCGFGIGSLLGPVLAGLVLRGGFGWRETYLAMGTGCLALLLVYAALARSGKSGAERSAAAAPIALRSLLDGRMIAIWLLLALYCGFQMGVNSWLPAFQSASLGQNPVAAGSGVSLFWFGLILSRLCSPFLLRRLEERKLLGCGFFIGGVFYLAGALSMNGHVLLAGCAAAGLFSGATNPLVITLGYRWHPEAPGKVSMLLFIAAAVGGIVVPWIMGMITGLLGLHSAILANGLLLAVAGAIALKLPGRAAKGVPPRPDAEPSAPSR